MPDPFESSRYSIEHANRHIQNFHAEWRSFMDGDPYAQVVEYGFPDIDIHKVKLRKPLPHALGAIAFDAVNSLRAALDQAGFAVAVAANTRGKNAHFPFGDSAAEVNSRKSGPAKDIPEEVFEVMASFKPYKGGNDTLWAVNRVSNTHKHESITATAIYVGGGTAVATFDGVRDFTFPPRWNSAKNEMVLAVVPRGSKPQYQLQVSAFVAFKDIERLASVPVSHVLDNMATTVERIVGAVESEARRLRLFS